jgi:hypothetical protein
MNLFLGQIIFSNILSQSLFSFRILFFKLLFQNFNISENNIISVEGTIVLWLILHVDFYFLSTKRSPLFIFILDKICISFWIKVTWKWWTPYRSDLFGGGSGEEVWDLFWNLVFLFCSHKVLNSTPNVFHKLPFVPQSIPNSTTLYPISFAQNFTFVNYISLTKGNVT